MVADTSQVTKLEGIASYRLEALANSYTTNMPTR
jgi:hypothetical protein